MLRPVDFARELEAQMVRWGQDVMSPRGNLLLLHGFVRLPAPESRGSSVYRRTFETGRLELHSASVTWFGGARVGLRFIRSLQRVYLWQVDDPIAPRRCESQQLILPRSADELGLFRTLAAELRAWMESYRQWRTSLLSSTDPAAPDKTPAASDCTQPA